ncbi:hypothetical protein F4679DRAFT_581998 [Xylaria curta]|nr:hypothetical protein F4679DRAFT_581998 [Xylaria curta]
MPFTASDICKIILAVILPPLGVFLERGCGADFLINILLTILGYFPGIIHALYVQVARRPSRCQSSSLQINPCLAPQERLPAQPGPSSQA